MVFVFVKEIKGTHLSLKYGSIVDWIPLIDRSWCGYHVHAESVRSEQKSRSSFCPILPFMYHVCQTNYCWNQHQYIIELDLKLVLACHVCIDGDKLPAISSGNFSENNVTFLKNERVDTAHEVGEILPDDWWWQWIWHHIPYPSSKARWQHGS